MYCVTRCLAAFAAATAFQNSSAGAGQLANALTNPQAVRLESATALATVPVTADIGGALDVKLAALVTSTKDERQHAWLAQLKSFYSSRNGRPVWVTDKGYSLQALNVVKVVAEARDYGLDPSLIPLPALPPLSPGLDQMAEAEIALSRAVVAYAFQARGGRIEPSELSLWLDRTPNPVYASGVMIEMATAKDPAVALRGMNPQSPAFDLLRQAYIAKLDEMATPRARDPGEILEHGPKITGGQSHPDVAMLRKRLRIAARPGSENLFDDRIADAVSDYVSARGVKVKWGVLDDKVRDVFNRPPPPPSKQEVMRILANMERWRWLPDGLGRMYIWNSLTEQITRVFKDGKQIHQERIIIGQPGTQTPVFSETMKAVVFQPEWGVPPSIKINELLPRLQDGDYGILNRRDMRILKGEEEVDPQDLHWDRIDIRQVGIYQRAGDDNPLGQVKFLFPNKNHVYMHDTNARSLFTAKDRLFSHGCIRVRDPEKLANIILSEDKGWDAKRVNTEMYNWDLSNNKVDLATPIPVHNVYFTLVPGENGELIELDDIYGHDERVIQALSGVPTAKIASEDPARDQLDELQDSAPPAATKKPLWGPGSKDDDARQ